MNDPASAFARRPRRPRRRAEELKGLARSAALSHLYRSAEAAAPPQHPPVSMFSGVALWEWIRHYLAYVFRTKHAFAAYTASPQHAMYELAAADGTDEVRVALAGDWGTGTDESEAVAQRMLEFDPHFTIHLGDVYYVGDPPEINENCLGITDPTNGYAPVTWPIGKSGIRFKPGMCDRIGTPMELYPVSIATMRHQEPKPVFWDDRVGANGFGVNGHVNLTFSGAALRATYVDLRGNALLEENWTSEGNGAVELVSRRKLIDDPDFHS